jgi:hypothetical protein
LVLVLLVTSAEWWNMILTGSDFGAIGVVFAVLTAAVNRLSRQSAMQLVFTAVVLCIAISSRVVLALPAIGIAAMGWQHHRRRSIGLMCLAATVTAGHYVVWPLTEDLTPFHHVGTAVDTLGLLALAIAGLGCLSAALLAAGQRNLESAKSWGVAWGILAFPLVLMCGFDLWNVRLQIASWDGSGVLGLAAPLLLGHVALSESQNRIVKLLI